MIKNTGKLSALLLAIAVSGCAVTNTAQDNGISVEQHPQVTYDVKPGDRLSDIALRLTGDASNWQTIAQRNGIANPKTLKAGDALIIPNELLDNLVQINRDSARQPAAKAVHVASNRRTTTLPVTTGNGVSVAHGYYIAKPQIMPASLFRVNINRSFDLKPFDAKVFSGKGPLRYDSEAPQIRVVGTYYPKGVYAQPANYARMVGRVAPGTVFELDRIVNEWYKILTDEGEAYIRQTDGALIQ